MVEIKDFIYMKDELSQIYKVLHQNPELGFLEFKTSEFIIKKLKEYGIEDIIVVAKTGVIANINGSKVGKRIMLRADMDALPIKEETNLEYKSQNDGIMHACGHDAHITMLLGAAKYFINNPDSFDGNVRLVFQPCEEGALPECLQQAIQRGCDPKGGAVTMINHGAVDDVDGCFAIHVNSLMDKGTMLVCAKEAMASSDMITVSIKGKGGHGSQPHNAIDTIPALGELIMAYNMLVPREISATEICVVSIGTVNTPSSAWNVIPEDVVITMGVRAFSNNVREYIVKRLEEITQYVTKLNRCTYSFDRITGYSPTINDENMVAIAKRSADKLLGIENVAVQKEPYTTSEDVGYYFEKTPGALLWLGVKDPEENSEVTIHSAYFKMALEALHIGVALHVSNAIQFLNE